MCKSRTEKYHTLFQRKGGKWRRHGKDKNHIFRCLENSSDDFRIQFVKERNVKLAAIGKPYVVLWPGCT